jgi:hypothetical protein
MTYQVAGETVTMTLSAAEVTEVVEALELVNPDSALQANWQQFRTEEFA